MLAPEGLVKNEINSAQEVCDSLMSAHLLGSERSTISLPPHNHLPPCFGLLMDKPGLNAVGGL